MSNPAACDIDSAYLQSSSNPMTLTFSSTSNELVVICVSPVLDNGFEKPIEEGIEDFIVIRKITPPPAVVINLPPRTDQPTVNAEIVFPFKGSYRHQFNTSSLVRCDDESKYGGKSNQGNNIPTLPMNSEGAWVLCVFAADELGNEQNVTNATKISINYSTTGTVAVLKENLDAYYNQSNAPGAINNPLEVEVNGVDGNINSHTDSLIRLTVPAHPTQKISIPKEIQ